LPANRVVQNLDAVHDPAIATVPRAGSYQVAESMACVLQRRKFDYTKAGRFPAERDE